MTGEELAREEAQTILYYNPLSAEEAERIAGDPKAARDLVVGDRVRRFARGGPPPEVDPLQTLANIATVAAVLGSSLAWCVKRYKEGRCQCPTPPSNRACGAKMIWGIDAAGYMQCVKGHKTQTPFRDE